jgi:hypothetical protein
MALIESHTAVEFTAVAQDAIKDCAACYDEFTTDDVWDWIERNAPVAVHDRRALGPIMQRMARAGTIRSTGRYIASVRRHCAPVMVWSA